MILQTSTERSNKAIEDQFTKRFDNKYTKISGKECREIVNIIDDRLDVAINDSDIDCSITRREHLMNEIFLRVSDTDSDEVTASVLKKKAEKINTFDVHALSFHQKS